MQRIPEELQERALAQLRLRNGEHAEEIFRVALQFAFAHYEQNRPTIQIIRTRLMRMAEAKDELNQHARVIGQYFTKLELSEEIVDEIVRHIMSGLTVT